MSSADLSSRVAIDISASTRMNVSQASFAVLISRTHPFDPALTSAEALVLNRRQYPVPEVEVAVVISAVHPLLASPVSVRRGVDVIGFPPATC
jgi:hypothetical protein